MKSERYYIVTYDIADPKRWRRVYKLLCGYGSWLQLSVFQLRMSEKRQRELLGKLKEIIHHDQDHVLCMDLGIAKNKAPNIVSLGKIITPLTREAVIV